jgi:hypothetical protein
LRSSAIATRRWTREETRERASSGPAFVRPSPDRSQLGDLVRGYEQITGAVVRSHGQRNLIAACYRVHGDDFLALVREWFDRIGATNLLGELRALPPRERGPFARTDSESGAFSEDPAEEPQPTMASPVGERPNCADAESSWCGCPEDDLRPGLLYCEFHYRSGYAANLRLDRRPSNPAARRFFEVASRVSSLEALD